MQIEHLTHRHGGRIVAIHSIGHVTERGVAWWFFRGDVQWPDSDKLHYDLEISPSCVCCDNAVDRAMREYVMVQDALNHYLKISGRWHDQKSKGDLVYSWTPKRKEGSRQIEDMVAELHKEAA